MSVLKKVWQLVYNTYTRFSDNGGSLLGAALAFYTIVSIAPLLLVLIAVAGFIFGDDVASGHLVGQLTAYVGEYTAKAVNELVQGLRRSQGGTHATLVGIVLVLWGASRLFGQLQDALNQLWQIRTEFKNIKESVLTLAYKKFISFLLVFAAGGAFVAVIIGSTVASTVKGIVGDDLPGSDFWWSAVPAMIVFVWMGILMAVFLRILPDATIAWRDAAMGSVVTAVLFGLAEFPLNYYLAHQGIETVYGAAGSLILFLFWVYYCAQIFFFGAQFAVVYGESQGRQLRPDASAVLLPPLIPR